MVIFVARDWEFACLGFGMNEVLIRVMMMRIKDQLEGHSYVYILPCRRHRLLD